MVCGVIYFLLKRVMYGFIDTGRHGCTGTGI